MRAQTETPTRQGPADWAIREDVCSRAVASVGVSVCSEYIEASNERSGECPESPDACSKERAQTPECSEYAQDRRECMCARAPSLVCAQNVWL